MKKKEEKSGFWVSLFAPRSCSCSCGGSMIEEVEEDSEKRSNSTQR